MDQSIDLVTALCVFFLMAIVGMELELDDFRRVFRTPKAAVLGSLGQVVLLPLVACGVALTLDFPPDVAGGLALLAACPGGGISNVFAYIARANLALSVTLTAVASMSAVITLPLLLGLEIRVLLAEEAQVNVPVANMVGQLIVIVLAPLALGMWMRVRFPEWVSRNKGRLRRVTHAVLGVVLSLAFYGEADAIAESVARCLVAALVWAVISLSLGYAVGMLLRLDADDCVTLAIEYANRNLAVAAAVAIASLDRIEFMGVPMAYIAVGYPMTLAISLLHRFRARSLEPS